MEFNDETTSMERMFLGLGGENFRLEQENIRLRRALDEADTALSNAVYFTRPGYAVNPNCLHRYLVDHETRARHALEVRR